MVIAQLHSKVIFLDTAPLIYFIEGHSSYQPTLLELFTGIDKGIVGCVTSTITLLEVLVKPIRDGRQDLVTQYQRILTQSDGIDILEITETIAVNAAQLRAAHGLKTPDALQLATALQSGADYFLTNDYRLRNVSAIDVITSADFTHLT